MFHSGGHPSIGARESHGPLSAHIEAAILDSTVIAIEDQRRSDHITKAAVDHVLAVAAAVTARRIDASLATALECVNEEWV
jgi:hypothetical protein